MSHCRETASAVHCSMVSADIFVSSSCLVACREPEPVKVVEPQSNYTRFNGMDSEGHPGKGRVPFEELGLEGHLLDLEGARKGQ